MPRWPPIQERLLNYRIIDGCWIWQGHTNACGYGLTGYRNYQWLVHRLVWHLTNGPIPDDYCILHVCDNPPCIRLEHLFLGTQRENIQDRNQKGRNARQTGEDAPTAKITEAGVKEIFRLRKSGLTLIQIGEVVGLKKSQVSNILRRTSWKHLPP